MDGPRFPSCSRCRDRIGAYEPMWWRRPDGTVAASRLLRLREEPDFAWPGSELFHRACLGGAGGGRGSERLSYR